MADLKQLVPWDSNAVEALLQQLRQRITEEREKGHDVGLVASLVIGTPEGRLYEQCCSPMPAECAYWAGEKLKEWAWTT